MAPPSARVSDSIPASWPRRSSSIRLTRSSQSAVSIRARVCGPACRAAQSAGSTYDSCGRAPPACGRSPCRSQLGQHRTTETASRCTCGATAACCSCSAETDSTDSTDRPSATTGSTAAARSPPAAAMTRTWTPPPTVPEAKKPVGESLRCHVGTSSARAAGSSTPQEQGTSGTGASTGRWSAALPPGSGPSGRRWSRIMSPRLVARAAATAVRRDAAPSWRAAPPAAPRLTG